MRERVVQSGRLLLHAMLMFAVATEPSGMQAGTRSGEWHSPVGGP